MIQKITLIALLSCILHSGLAQKISNGISYEDLIKGEHAVIEKENLEINIYGKERSSTDLNSTAYRSFRIRREITVKILTSEGIEQFGKIRLPSDFDPLNLPHGPPVKNLGIYYSAFKISDFSVSAKRKRKTFKPKVKKKVHYIESFNLDFLYNYSQYEYSIVGLDVGDEVTIKYDLTIPFQENYSRFASYRIFHHEAVPKKKYRLTLTHHKTLDIDIFEKNGANKLREFENENVITRVYEYDFLPGCTDEPGSKPYNELPHIQWVINHYKYYVHNDVNLQNIPHYALIAQIKSPNLASIFQSIQIGSRSKDFLPFNQTYDRLTDGIPSDYQRIRHLHNKINEDFKYSKDIEYYRRNDMKDENLGIQFQNGIIRDGSRYNLYYALLAKTDLKFYSVYVQDWRVGQMSDEFFQPNFDNDYLLGVYFGERTFDLMLPKHGQKGLYYNEIPFYWEGSRSRLVHITDYATYKVPVNEEFRSYRTPVTPADSNRRSQKFRAAVDLNIKTVQFSGNISMSGQFSTMCRGTYIDGFRDKTAHRNYRRPLWRSIPNCDQEQLISSYSSEEFPHKADFEMSFVGSRKVEEEHGQYKINLENWFPHASPDLDFSQNRYLTYYPDFQGVDSFEYELQFTRNVELLEPINISLENEFGKYSFTVTQENPQIIKIQSVLDVRNSQIDVSDFEKVSEIYKTAAAYNSHFIKVK